jgi:murein L,D-transpeptidase YcbB/YkuD
VALIAVCAGFAMPAPGPTSAVKPADIAKRHPDPVARALRTRLGAEGPSAIGAVYEQRGDRPLWVEGRRLAPAADEMLALVRAAADDGLDPAAYDPDALAILLTRARNGEKQDLAAADIALSRTLDAWARDLHSPKPAAAMVYTDPAVAPPSYRPGEALTVFAQAPTYAAGLAHLRRMNPVYDQLRLALSAALSRGDASTARLIRTNLERARALPPDLGPRYVLVDVAAQQLEMWDQGRLSDTMPVVVGKRSEPTPAMAGLIRFAVLNPYWHMPPDLAAERIAPAVIRAGVGELDRRGFEVVSNFGPDANPVDAQGVDWPAVAAGRQKVYLRQAPGPDNMMGQVKFIFPNRLGVYLHDTPLKGLFRSDRRADSAGCVRVADAPRLARWLTGSDLDLRAGGEPEKRLDLPQPVPVYLVYLTARPMTDGLQRRQDFYGRDGIRVAASS